jgi:hypothetical protein
VSLRAALALAALLVSATASADIFSPGDLAKGHDQLEGMRNCTQCHPAGSKLSQETCLSCHVELKPEVSSGKGFHGRILREQRECEKCHSEHQGRDFKLTDWGPGGIKSFEHQKAGWPLLGKHAQVSCAGCHEKRYILSETVLKLISEQRFRENPTMLGLSTRCEACHFDEHRGQTVKDCQTCHNEKVWNPAPGFNHQKTTYPLEGKHKKVACEKCHPSVRDEQTAGDAFPKPVSMSFMKYAPIAHKECLSCHEDPHKGAFGERCQQCHTVDGWLIIRNKLQETAFHDKTRYPLRGEHTAVACVACHGPFPGVPAQFKRMKFESCTDCHVDAHAGQLPKATPSGPKCETCHSVDGFKPVNFDLEEHAKTRYPLEGAHRLVACNACHVPEPRLESRVPATLKAFLKRRNRQALFSLTSLALPKVTKAAPCEQCHADTHAGQFKRRACTGCHVVEAWSKLDFNHDKDTKFPLEGKHKDAACASCHPMGNVHGTKTVRYVGVEHSCDGCHADVHVGQFAPEPGAETDCSKCHDAVDFKRTSFAHAPPFTEYLLEGAHKTVACEACHTAVKVSKGVTAVRYKPLPTACEGCHTDFHKGAFKGFIP